MPRLLREGDTLVIWKLDRLGRSLCDLLEVVELLENSGVQFRFSHRPRSRSSWGSQQFGISVPTFFPQGAPKESEEGGLTTARFAEFNCIQHLGTNQGSEDKGRHQRHHALLVATAPAAAVCFQALTRSSGNGDRGAIDGLPYAIQQRLRGKFTAITSGHLWNCRTTSCFFSSFLGIQAVR